MTSSYAPARTAPPRTAKSYSVTSPRRSPARLFALLALAVVVIAFVAPMLWLVLGSFHKDAGLSVPFGAGWSLENYRKVMNGPTLWTPLRNSLVLAGCSAILTVIVASLAA